MNTKKMKISQSFQRWLIVLVVFAFLATTVFLWMIQTRLSENNAINLLRLNLSDVRQDISDASDANLLKLTERVAAELNAAPNVTNDLLDTLMAKYDVTEINVIDAGGIIAATTYRDFLGYDMRTGEQSAEFMVLLNGETSYVQSYQPVSFKESDAESKMEIRQNKAVIKQAKLFTGGNSGESVFSRKYGGVVLQRGGFVQVGYGSERFQRDIDEFVIGVTRNRHVGEGGSIIIIDEAWNIVSDRNGNEGKNLDVTGIWLDTSEVSENEVFLSDVYGQHCYCMYQAAEGYRIVAVMPQSEAALSRNVSVSITTGMQVIVFATLFVMIFILVNRLVVRNIYKINSSLSDITDGKLDTVVDVRSHAEFDALSNDINATVNTLKRYIADAAARIDAELAFAKAIQHSALPSVFPPYPAHREFDIYASMFTAKEVGGDFYDFYFIDEDTLAFLIADVSGKGIPAAMFMMQSKALLKSCAESGMSIEKVFTTVNEKLCEGNEAGMFVTAWMGFLNVKTGVVTFANAGHNPPLVKAGDNGYTCLKTRAGFVLAGMENIRYRKNELKLMPGDAIYLYTDGVTEAADVQQKLYGEERLLALLNGREFASAKEVCDQVKADVDAFAGEAEQFDDITMLCLKWHGPQESEA